MNNYYQVNIAIISIYSFPFGLAPTNRILAYSKGMIENGATVTIYLPFPTDRLDESSLLNNCGKFDGINYIYTSGRYKSNNKISRALAILTGYRKLIGYLTSFKKIYKDSIKQSFNCLIISSDYIPTLFIFRLLAKCIKTRCVFIFDEYPTPIRHQLKDRIPIWKEFLYRKVLSKINGYISISDTLKEFYCKLSTKKTFVLSSITDISRFEYYSMNNTKTTENSYLCYMGNMELTKDDVDNIIKAYSCIVAKYPNIKLHLYGRPNHKTIKILTSLIKELNLEDKVFMLGSASYEEVPRILCAALILVSSQPNTVRASGGFPTKLGEYLASGRPALLTDVGENSKYVKDNIHMFFVEPNNPIAYANRLEFILNNYEAALQVAAQGKSFLLNNYSTVKRGSELIQFISTL
jgi:glycosyltransferase involved in cell wall biosynthesis